MHQIEEQKAMIEEQKAMIEEQKAIAALLLQVLCVCKLSAEEGHCAPVGGVVWRPLLFAHSLMAQVLQEEKEASASTTGHAVAPSSVGSSTSGGKRRPLLEKLEEEVREEFLMKNREVGSASHLAVPPEADIGPLPAVDSDASDDDDDEQALQEQVRATNTTAHAALTFCLSCVLSASHLFLPALLLAQSAKCGSLPPSADLISLRTLQRG